MLSEEEVKVFLSTVTTGGSVHYPHFPDLIALKKHRYELFQLAKQHGLNMRSTVDFKTLEMTAWVVQKNG